MTPTTPEPGYRFLSPEETLQEGDELWFPEAGKWIRTHCAGWTVARAGTVPSTGVVDTYRRRYLNCQNTSSVLSIDLNSLEKVDDHFYYKFTHTKAPTMTTNYQIIPSPLPEPKPVTLADMPENVWCVVVYGDMQETWIRCRVGTDVHRQNQDGSLGGAIGRISAQKSQQYRVLQRLDCQPLPTTCPKSTTDPNVEEGRLYLSSTVNCPVTILDGETVGMWPEGYFTRDGSISKMTLTRPLPFKLVKREFDLS